MTAITTSTAAAFIPEIWLNTGLKILRSKIVMARRVMTDASVGVFKQGDILNIPYAGTFTAVQKASNTPY